MPCTCNVLRWPSSTEPSVQMPEFTPLLGSTHTSLQDRDRPVAISLLTAPKTREYLNLNNCCSKGSLCLQLSGSLCEEMPGGRVGMSFLPRKSSWASLAHSYSLADLEPKQVKIALIFFEAEINGLMQNWAEGRNSIAGFNGWPKPG